MSENLKISQEELHGIMLFSRRLKQMTFDIHRAEHCEHHVTALKYLEVPPEGDDADQLFDACEILTKEKGPTATWVACPKDCGLCPLHRGKQE